MSQEMLSALSILCIESDKLRQTNFDELLDDFVMKKPVLVYLMIVASLFLNMYFKADCIMTK